MDVKKWIIMLFVFMAAMGLTGCDNELVNPGQPIVDVGERNKDVLDALRDMGAISAVQADNYSSLIDSNVEKYKKILDGDDDSKVDDIKRAIVNVLGNNPEQGLYGIYSTHCPYDSSEEYLTVGGDSSFEITDINSSGKNEWLNNFAKASGNAGKQVTPYYKSETGVESKEVVPLTFIDKNNLSSLVRDINKPVWVLNPDSLQTKQDLVNLINILQNLKVKKETSEVTYNDFLPVLKYFTPGNATIYSYTEDSIVDSTTDNSSGLGKETPDNSSLNKDIVITGTVSGQTHMKTDDPQSPCKKESSSRNVGVYTLRVQEFDADLVQEINQGAFTKNKYVAVSPRNDNEVGSALLMEYPVSVIDKLVADSSDSSAWHFEWKDSDMRVNIFNGEILYKQLDGSYAVINQDKDKLEEIYRITGVNVTKATDVGKNISFMPNGSTTLGLEAYASMANKKVKLLSLLSSGTDEMESGIGIKLNTWYPIEILKKDDVKYTTLGSNYSFHIYGDSYNTVDTEIKQIGKIGSLRVEISDLVYGSGSNWNKIWEYYEKKAKEINSKYDTSYSESRTDWNLYKLYQALEDNGSILDSDIIGKWFSSVDIFNALYDAFRYDHNRTSYLTDYYTDYDNAWILSENKVERFIYNISESQVEEFEWFIDSSLMSANDNLILDNSIAAVNELSDDALISYYEQIGRDGHGKMFNTPTLCEFTASSASGKEVDVVTGNLKYNSDTKSYEYKYGNVWYSCSAPMDKEAVGTQGGAGSKDIKEVTTVRFALTDYLELTYMPGVVANEDFIATGRRISITDISGKGDQVIGFFANKLGDKSEGKNVDIRVSDIISYNSGQASYYDEVAKVLSSVQTNSDEVEAELKKDENDRGESLKTILDPTANIDNATGMLEDNKLLNYKVGLDTVFPIIKFTSKEEGDKPSLDSIDLNNENLVDNVYFGLCVNTHAFNSGLYTNWIDINSDGGDNGSLRWWNNWLANHGYKYQIDVNRLKSVMSGVYSVSLAKTDGTIVFDADTIRVINQEMNKDKEETSKSLLNTITTLLGGFLLIYGLILMGFWVLDVNMVNGPGFLTIATFGKFVAITDSSEVPLMPGDGRIYVDFKALFTSIIIFIIVGILLIIFDIQVFWEYIPKLYESLGDTLSDLLLNK